MRPVIGWMWCLVLPVDSACKSSCSALLAVVAVLCEYQRSDVLIILIISPEHSLSFLYYTILYWIVTLKKFLQFKNSRHSHSGKHCDFPLPEPTPHSEVPDEVKASITFNMLISRNGVFVVSACGRNLPFFRDHLYVDIQKAWGYYPTSCPATSPRCPKWKNL